MSNFDKTFFWNSLRVFEKEYDVYVKDDIRIDEYGNRKISFATYKVFLVLETMGRSKQTNQKGNYLTNIYKWYSRDTYRLDVGDFIQAGSKTIMITEVRENDDYGVREGSGEVIDLSNYRDLDEFIKTLRERI